MCRIQYYSPPQLICCRPEVPRDDYPDPGLACRCGLCYHNTREVSIPEDPLDRDVIEQIQTYSTPTLDGLYMPLRYSREVKQHGNIESSILL